jgi:hypothetical protein
MRGKSWLLTMLNKDDNDRAQADAVIGALRASADKLIARSEEFAEEALRLKQRADDLAQLIKQSDDRKQQRPPAKSSGLLR